MVVMEKFVACAFKIGGDGPRKHPMNGTLRNAADSNLTNPNVLLPAE